MDFAAVSQLDFAMLYWIQDVMGSPVMDTVMPVITTFGTHGYLWIAVSILLLFFRKTRRWGITLLVTLGVVWAACEFGLKELIARPRPFMVDTSYALVIAAPSGFSMPSGHTLTAFIAATILARSPIARGWKAAAWVMAVLIAFSRLYLFVHFPTDVLAGAVIGVIAGLIGAAISNAISRAWQSGGKHSAKSPLPH